MHAHPLQVAQTTDISTRRSGLEELVSLWNQLPERLAELPFTKLKNELVAENYLPDVDVYRDLLQCVRVL